MIMVKNTFDEEQPYNCDFFDLLPAFYFITFCDGIRPWSNHLNTDRAHHIRQYKNERTSLCYV